MNPYNVEFSDQTSTHHREMDQDVDNIADMSQMTLNSINIHNKADYRHFNS